MLQIVTDSTCDLPPDVLAQLDVHVVPVTIRFGEEAFLEGVTITPSTFYDKVHTLGMIPKTSQPSPGQMAEIYRAAGKNGDPVLSVHITGKLSGTCNSAELAKTMVQDEVQVEVFDSMAGSSGLGFMVWEARRMSRAGASLPEILARLHVVRQQVMVYLTLQDLKFAQMSGRVNTLQFALASLLDVKPLVGLKDGTLEVQGRVRSRKRALHHILDLVAARVGQTPINCAVVHARAPEEAAELMKMAEQRFTFNWAFITPLCISIAANLGPGTLGIVAYPA